MEREKTLAEAGVRRPKLKPQRGGSESTSGDSTPKDVVSGDSGGKSGARTLPNAERIVASLVRAGVPVRKEKSLAMRLKGSGDRASGLQGADAWRAFEMHVLNDGGTAPAQVLSMLFKAMLMETSASSSTATTTTGGGGGGLSRRQRKSQRKYEQSGLRAVAMDMDCICEGVLDFLEKLQSEAVLNIPSVLDVVVFNTVIRGLCSAGRPQLAEKVMALLFADARCAVGGGDDAMAGDALVPDIRTVEPLLVTWTKEGNLQRSLAIIQSMERDAGIWARESTFNGLIQSCCEARPHRITEALALLEQWLNDSYDVEKIARRGSQVRPSAATYGIIMTALVRDGRAAEAVKLLLRMPNQGVRPKAGNFNIIIDGLAKAGNARAAEDWLREMQGGGLFDVESLGIEPNVRSYGCVVEAHAANGDFDAASRIVTLMRQNGVQPDVTVYGSLVKACGRAGRLDELESILGEMASADAARAGGDPRDENTVVANVVVLTSAIAGYVAGGDLGAARRLLLQRMDAEFGVPPTRASFHALLRGYATLGMAVEANDLVEDWKGGAGGVVITAGRNAPDKETAELIRIASTNRDGARELARNGNVYSWGDDSLSSFEFPPPSQGNTRPGCFPSRCDGIVTPSLRRRPRASGESTVFGWRGAAHRCSLGETAFSFSAAQRVLRLTSRRKARVCGRRLAVSHGMRRWGNLQVRRCVA